MPYFHLQSEKIKIITRIPYSYLNYNTFAPMFTQNLQRRGATGAHFFPFQTPRKPFCFSLLTNAAVFAILYLLGALAQLGAHNTGSVGVRGSSPLCSTKKRTPIGVLNFFAFYSSTHFATAASTSSTTLSTITSSPSCKLRSGSLTPPSSRPALFLRAALAVAYILPFVLHIV